MPIGIKNVLECFLNVARNLQKWTLWVWGSEFQRDGADTVTHIRPTYTYTCTVHTAHIHTNIHKSCSAPFTIKLDQWCIQSQYKIKTLIKNSAN